MQHQKIIKVVILKNENIKKDKWYIENLEYRI